MRRSIRRALCLLSIPAALPLAAGSSLAAGAALPAGYWQEAQAEQILARTLTLRLAPDLSDLTDGEREAVGHLISAGRIFQRLYELQKHRQAPEAREALEELHRAGREPSRTSKLLDLYRLAKGPVITTLDNRREPFLPVEREVPGKNVYPSDLRRAEMEGYLGSHPGLRGRLLHPRAVVRRASMENLQRDLGRLRQHPGLDLLHPGLREWIEDLAGSPAEEKLYALPYSVAWVDETMEAYAHLVAASEAVEKDDADFARFLRHRARDLLADDYDAGDASWVTGRFGSLNAQIGAYETYDDELYGARTFYSLAVLRRDEEGSRALREAVRGLQEIEDLLPYDAHRRVREEIPVGLYDVVADFGQSRGSNSATILPNESHLARQHGRTILLRANILRNPDLFQVGASTFKAAVASDQADDLTPEGHLRRILWHEIGHYLGADLTRDGRNLEDALQDTSDLLEEMKADLVSLYAIEPLRKKGYYDDRTARSAYASGILRVLQKARPRREQPYQTMQLIQWNWLLDRGVLQPDPESGRLRIVYDRYRDAVEALLRETLSLQLEGDRERAEAFIREWTTWREDLHEAVAKRLRAEERYRFTLIRYAALGE